MSVAETEARDPNAPIIEIIGLNKWFGPFHVLRDINLSVAQRERLSLIHI